MKIEDLIRFEELGIEDEVEVEGVFMFGPSVCKITEVSYKNKENPLGISIENAGLEEMLYKRGPALGGGSLTATK